MDLSSVKLAQTRALCGLLVACGGFFRVLCGCEAQQVLDPFPEPGGPRETLVTGRPCASNADCELREPYCDEIVQRCVECRTGDDCPDAFCDPQSRSCRERCSDNQDCSGRAWLCEESRSVCVECATNAHCGAERPLCNAGTCIECLTLADCSANTPYCDPTTGRCRECLTDEDCQSAERCSRDGMVCVDRNPN